MAVEAQVKVLDRDARARRGFLVTAIGMAAALIPLAFVLPVMTVDTGRAGVQPRASLVSGDGPAVLAWVVVPLLITLGVAGLLAFLRGPVSVGRVRAARAGAIGLAVAAVAAVVTILIGMYVVPIAISLLVAAFLPPVPAATEQLRVTDDATSLR